MSRDTPRDPPPVSQRVSPTAGADQLLHILRRRWRIVITLAVVIGAGSYALSAHKHPTYAASADVLLSHQNLAASLNNIPDPGTANSDLNRAAQTQANIATAPAVISMTLTSLGLPQSQAGTLQAHSTVKAAPTADILTFTVQDANRNRAMRLAGAYAHSYTVYRRTLDSAGVELALTGVRQRLQQLHSQASPNTTLINNLTDNEDRLNTLASFQASNASVVRSPQAAVQVSPKPTRALLLGLLFGAMLGLVLAMLRDRFDTRVQDADEVVEELGMPLLAGIPELSKRHRQSHELVMLTEPGGIGSEAFRVLRTSVEFATIDDDTKMIMVSSAVQAEGKSTTAANLAVAFARAGRRVVLVDLDLRRPWIAQFFGAVGRPGLTDVALGHLPLREALVSIKLGPQSASGPGHAGSNGDSRSTASRASFVEEAERQSGSLRVLTSGPTPPDAGEFVASGRVHKILDDVRVGADVVIVDAPPVLTVSDALVISSHVTALLFVARLGVVRRSMFKEVRRVLERCPAHVIGCVVTGVQLDQTYGYGYGYAYVASGEAVTPLLEDAPPALGARPTGRSD